MTEEESFQQAMRQQPDALDLRLIYADWLEEQGDPRGELLRLLHTLTQAVVVPQRPKQERRLRALLTQGVQPLGPFVTNTVGMQFAWIAPGRFLMGSPPGEAERDEDETQHGVTLTKGFYLGVQPVTQVQWQQVLSNNPSHYKGDDRPVDTVSWDDCQDLCQMLAQREGQRYRLPTEAEWEYACRAGTTTPFFFGETISPGQVNYDGKHVQGQDRKDTSRQETPVGSFPANAWGLCDMHRNLLEWCQDWYSPYRTGDVEDPKGPETGFARIVRGGSCIDRPWWCRSARRNWIEVGRRSCRIGCRVCLCLD